jgi:WD40 repeat protein
MAGVREGGVIEVRPIDGFGEVLTFGRPGADFRGVQFSDDGERLLAASMGEVWIWSLDLTGLEDDLRARTTACLTVEQRVRYLYEPAPAAAAAARACERLHGRPIRESNAGAAATDSMSSPQRAVRLARADGDPAVAFAILRDSDAGPRDAWLAETQEVARDLPAVAILAGHDGLLRSAVFSVDGSQVLTVGMDGTARVWRADGRGAPLVLDPREHRLWAIRAAAISPDAQSVVTLHQDGPPRVWRVDGVVRPIGALGKEDAGPEGEVQFSPQGERLLVRAGDEVWVHSWPKQVGPGPVRLTHENFVDLARFSPDGDKVLTVAHPGIARVWRVDGTEEPLFLTRHQLVVADAAWSPDGQHVATGGWSTPGPERRCPGRCGWVDRTARATSFCCPATSSGSRSLRSAGTARR